MEDTQNNQSQTQNAAGQVTPTQTGGIAKEVERPVSSYVQKSVTSETEPTIEQELKDIGVESRTEQPELDSTHEQIGIKHAPSDTPFRPDSGANVQLPMTEEEAQSVMAQYKNKVTYDIGEHGEHDAYVIPSRLGLATLVDKINKFINLFKPKKRVTA